MWLAEKMHWLPLGTMRQGQVSVSAPCAVRHPPRRRRFFISVSPRLQQHPRDLTKNDYYW